MPEAIQQEPPIGQTRQRIVEGEMQDFVLGALALGNICIDREDSLRLSVVISDQRPMGLHVQHTLVPASLRKFSSPFHS